MSHLRVNIDYPLFGTYIKQVEDTLRKMTALLDKAVLDEKNKQLEEGSKEIEIVRTEG